MTHSVSLKKAIYHIAFLPSQYRQMAVDDAPTSLSQRAIFHVGNIVRYRQYRMRSQQQSDVRKDKEKKKRRRDLKWIMLYYFHVLTADVCVMFSLCLLHSCFWAAVDLLSSLWEQLTSTTTSRGIPAPCTLDLCTPCALLVPFVASFSEPICFHIMWIPFPTTSPHLISVRNYLTCQFPGCSSLFYYGLFTFTDSTDRHWVGMWWGGFLICGVSLVLIAIPFFFFPKELKVHRIALVFC